jgi:hypothetical protein
MNQMPVNIVVSGMVVAVVIAAVVACALGSLMIASLGRATRDLEHRP